MSSQIYQIMHTGRQASIRQEGKKVFGIYIFSKNVFSNMSDNAYWQVGKRQAGGNVLKNVKN